MSRHAPLPRVLIALAALGLSAGMITACGGSSSSGSGSTHDYCAAVKDAPDFDAGNAFSSAKTQAKVVSVLNGIAAKAPADVKGEWQDLAKLLKNPLAAAKDPSALKHVKSEIADLRTEVKKTCHLDVS